MNDLKKQLAQLPKLKGPELKAKYEEVFGEPCTSRNRNWIVKRLAWRIQANVLGGLSERALKRAAELADEADLRLAAPKPPDVVPMIPARDPRLPKAGTLITRTYKGQTITVQVLENGFSFGGVTYRTLTAVAKEITGLHTNGFRFFGLTGKGGRS